MKDDPQLFWFGCVLVILSVCLLLSLVRTKTSLPVVPSEAAIAADLTALQQQCLRLREALHQQKTQLNEDFQDATFAQLQTLLTNYPSACKMAQAKPDLPARNLVALFTPLENLLQTWSIEPIGTAWERVPFHPQLHQPDTDDIAPEEPVYIRFVGYRHSDRILCPAKVSRTLPGGVGDKG